MKALLLENIHPEGVRLLTERGIEVETVRGALDEAELIDALPGVQLLGIRSKTNVTRNVLKATSDLQAIGAFCIGTNQQRHSRLQRPLLQHAQRRRARDRRDHFPGAASHRQEHQDARRYLGQVRQGRP